MMADAIISLWNADPVLAVFLLFLIVGGSALITVIIGGDWR